MADLRLLYTNDMHGRTASLDLLARQPRDARTLLLDGGDALCGSNTVYRRHEPVLDQMRKLGFAAMAMGNRELHYLRRVMGWRRDQRRFPLLAANLVDLRHPQHDLWQSVLELHVEDVKVGLIGATVVQYPHGSVWERLFGLRFFQPEDCLPQLVEEMRDRCDVVLLLSHLGFEVDCRIASRLPRVDLILGAHSHTVLQEPHRVAGVPIVQAGSHSRYLAELRLGSGKVEYQLHSPALVA